MAERYGSTCTTPLFRIFRTLTFLCRQFPELIGTSIYLQLPFRHIFSNFFVSAGAAYTLVAPLPPPNKW